MLRPLQVAAGLIDVERRHPGHVRLDHPVEHRVERSRIGFAPELARPAEAIHLVGVVVRGREVLYAIEQRGIGNAVPVLDAGGAELDVIPRIRLVDAGVVRDAESLLVRLVLHRRHQVAVDAEELDAVDTHPLELAARGFAPARRCASAHRPRSIGVDEEARRGDFALARCGRAAASVFRVSLNTSRTVVMPQASQSLSS